MMVKALAMREGLSPAIRLGCSSFMVDLMLSGFWSDFNVRLFTTKGHVAKWYSNRRRMKNKMVEQLKTLQKHPLIRLDKTRTSKSICVADTEEHTFVSKQLISLSES
jgi:hypothetical protein